LRVSRREREWLYLAKKNTFEPKEWSIRIVEVWLAEESEYTAVRLARSR